MSWSRPLGAGTGGSRTGGRTSHRLSRAWRDCEWWRGGRIWRGPRNIGQSGCPYNMERYTRDPPKLLSVSLGQPRRRSPQQSKRWHESTPLFLESPLLVSFAQPNFIRRTYRAKYNPCPTNRCALITVAARVSSNPLAPN